jgi:hypothetical protein
MLSCRFGIVGWSARLTKNTVLEYPRGHLASEQSLEIMVIITASVDLSMCQVFRSCFKSVLKSWNGNGYLLTHFAGKISEGMMKVVALGPQLAKKNVSE